MSSEDRDWRVNAACRRHPARLWFPEAKGAAARAKLSVDALRICNNECTAQADCADDALRHNVVAGIVAGIDLGNNYSRQKRTARETAVLEQIARTRP